MFFRDENLYHITFKDHNIDLGILAEELSKFLQSLGFEVTKHKDNKRFEITAENNSIFHLIMGRQMFWQIIIFGDSNNFIISIPYLESTSMWFFLLIPMMSVFGESHDREVLFKIDRFIQQRIKENQNNLK